ncbi:MAG: endopeptidase La [Candidatus Shikimatogenerans bostrichidophilus]|nr:MAG: endopeptidase La [Candidatus Shikimatogenerans bostrichidophilus]
MIKNFNFYLIKYIYILPIKNIILFPGLILPIIISKKKNIKLIKNIYKKKKKIGIITKKNKKKIYNIGTIAYIIKIFKMPNNNLTVILQGKIRFKVIKLFFKKKKFYSKIRILNYFFLKKKYFIPILELIKKISKKILNKDIINFNLNIKNINNIIFLIYFLSININISIKKKQYILKENNIIKKTLNLLKYLNIEYKRIKIKKKIQKKIQKKIKLQQKKYFLKKQINILQKELKINNNLKEINLLIKKSLKKKWSNEAKKKFNIEILNLKNINNKFYEYYLLKNYILFLLNLPWYKYTKNNFNFKRAIKILNKNHYGLKKIKNRILEYLTILKFKKNIKAPILCFLGPPGVGKTSLGKSISKVLCRKYIRMSLGGIHDESIIRGHRKTYIGAMPGRILQLIKKAGISNPVFILDEIDKISNINNFNGNPLAAMLEILDPEQNKYFYDNYLEIDYDLSKVFFIATANNINNIDKALLDRMEIININGYTIEEKIKIVENILLPKILKKYGLNNNKKKLILKKKNIEKIIINYTFESGIRSLERCLLKIIYYIIKNIVIYKKYINNINIKLIEKVLGYSNKNKFKLKKIKIPGISIGLAWTNLGGDIIYIESILLKSNIKNNGGNLNITGNIGKIMKESAIIAFKYIKSNYKILNINFNIFRKYDIHLHVPEGSIPKDGPSAGISILISLISLFKNKKIKSFLAMTGEITLKGEILEVGGIKEKILAAKRYSIKKIILPYNNKKNILYFKKKDLLGLKFNYVKNIKEVIKLSFN